MAWSASCNRLVAGAILGVAVWLRWGRDRVEEVGRWPRCGAWPRLVTCGVVWFGLYNIALNAAERRVDAGTAAMLATHLVPPVAIGSGKRGGDVGDPFES